MIIALIAKLIVKHIPALNNEILHAIPNKMCKCRIEKDMAIVPCGNCQIKEKDCWQTFIQTKRFCCDKCNHGNMERQ